MEAEKDFCFQIFHYQFVLFILFGDDEDRIIWALKVLCQLSLLFFNTKLTEENRYKVLLGQVVMYEIYY